MPPSALDWNLSVAEVPSALLAQLKVGGRLAAIVGEEPVMRAVVVRRRADRGLQRDVVERLPAGAARERQFPRALQPRHGRLHGSCGFVV